MRNISKRLTALLLLLCLLATFVVPATFAEDQPETVTYNFKLYENSSYMDYIAALVGATVGGHNLYKYTVGSASANGYKWFLGDFTQKINWAPEGSDSATANLGKDYYVDIEAQNGLRIDLGKTNDGKNGWTALRLDVPAAGTYKLELSMPGGTDSDHIATGDQLNVYLFEALEDYALKADNITQINEKLATVSAIGTIAYETGKTDYTIGESYTFLAAGQYVLVLQEETAATCRYFHLDTLTLTPASETEETTETTQSGDTITGQDTAYYFDLPNWNAELYSGLNGKSYASKYTPPGGSEVRVYKYLEGLYPATLNWKHQESVFTASGGVGNIEVRKGQGLRIYGQMGDWTAIRLSGITAGLYDITLTGNGTSSMNTVDAYLVKATDSLVLAESMIADNLILSGMKDSGSYSVQQKALEQSDYFLVIKHTAMGNSGYWCLTEFALTAVAESTGEPEETTTAATEATTTETTTAETTMVETTQQTTVPAEPARQTYDFEIYNNQALLAADTAGVIAGKKANAYSHKPDGTTRLYNWFYTAYANGTVNWRIESSTGFSDAEAKTAGTEMKNFVFRGDTEGGMELSLVTKAGVAAGQWAAVRIKVAAAGEYAVRLVGGGSSSKADVYIFPAADEKTSINYRMTDMAEDDAYKISPYLTDSNKVGNVSLTPGVSRKAGNWSFSNAGDYIVVFRIPEKGTKDIWLKKLELVPVAEDVEIPTEPSGETEPSVPDAPPAMENTGNFNFNIVTDYPDLFGDLSGLTLGKKYTPAHTGKEVRVYQYLESLYPTTLNWVHQESYFQAGGGVANIQLRPNQGLRIYGQTGDWTAIKLAVPASCEYNLKLTSGGANTVNLYLMKYTAGMDIAAGMTEENLLIADVKAATAAAIVEKMALEAGEYLLVVKHTSSDVDTYWYLTQVELEVWTEKAPVPVSDKKVYEFDMGAKDADFLKKSLSSRLPDGVTRAYAKLAQMYAEDQANWKLEGSSATFIMGEFSFRDTGFRLKAKENMNMRTDPWIAFRIKNPGTETYDVRLITKDKSAVCVNIYLIPVQNTLVLTQEQISAAMTTENLLVENAQIDEKGTFYLGEYTFGIEDEYVMVLDFIKGAGLNLDRIEMTKDGLVADGTVKHGSVRKGYVYDFDLGDELDGIYTGSQTNLVDVLDDMNQRWADGRLNWKFLSATPERFLGTTVETRNTPNKNLRFYRSSGFRAYGQPDTWIALKIKSPGSGDFTVTLNHAVCPTSGTVAFYVLPGDTDPADYWGATDPENRIGKVQLNNKTGVTGVEDGHTSFVGYWNFEAGKEYVLVIEFYEPSLFDGTRAYMNISQLVLERGIIDYGTSEDEKRVSSITVLDEAVTVADAGTYGAVMEVNGHDWYFQSLEGGYMLVYDLDTRQLVDKVYTGHARSNCCVGPDGKVYAYAGNLVIYDPATGITEYTASVKTGAGLETLSGFSGIAIAEDGTVWAGGSYGGYLFSYDVNTKVYTSYGMPLGYHNRMTGLIIKNGYIYAGIHGDGDDQIMKWEIATQKVVATYDITDMMGTAEYIQSLNFLGDDLLIAGGNGLFGPIVLNADLEPVEHNLYSYPNLSVSEEIDGKYYMMLASYGLYQYDMATKEFSKVPGFGTEGLGFRTGAQNSFGKTLVTIDGDRCLITYSTGAQGNPRFFNLDTKEYFAWDDLVVHGAGGTSLRGFTNGQKGSNLIHFGGFNTTLCVAYNTEKGEVEYYYNTGGQTDCQIWYEGKLYAGNYSSTTLNEIYPDPANTSLPAPNELIQRWRLDHAETGQKRVHAIAAGDGYIFNGTVSDSNLLGGAVVVYDTRTGRWKYHRHAVENQTITAMTYADGVLYGGSFRGGGSGSIADPNTSAVIFAYDYKEMKVDAVLDPRDYISGLPAQIDYIASLEADPQVEGRIWAVVMETLFCFTYDKENKTFHVQEVISFSKDWEDESFQKKIIFDLERNYMYLAFGHHGGFQRIELENWDAPVGQVKVKSNLRVMDQTPEWYVMGEDGNIYYPNAADTGDLMMFPLNVTDEDWAIAEEVDNMFLAIGDEITLETEAAIKSARSAYENLGWRYKALIRKLEVLQEAESDILECKIATLEGVTMTADDFPAMTELLEEYKGLNARQQRYVKNYELLKTQYDIASDLNDQRIAAATQKRIDKLQDKFPLTLDDEPEVLDVRAEVSSLTGKQFILLDTAILEEAEAQIAVLRAEFVKYVETLILAIPEEITLEAEPAITAARAGADKLYTSERKQVSYSKLTSAEGKLRTLQKAKAAAEEVDALILAIGIVTWGDKARIAEARDAYEGLNGTALSFLQYEKKLITAEKILKALETWAIPVMVVAILGAGFCVIRFIPALRSKVFKPKKKEESNS